MNGLRIIATFGALFVVSAGLGAASLVGLVAQRLGFVGPPIRWPGDERQGPTPPAYASKALRVSAKRWRTGHVERRKRWEGRAT